METYDVLFYGFVCFSMNGAILYSTLIVYAMILVYDFGF